jgi:holo-[acyl-carrier protein] synthase
VIRGIGVDILEIHRIRQDIERYGDLFLEKVFTDSEIAYCREKHNIFQHFAARFASKEAFSKALATGWKGDFRWRDVEVVNDHSGQPRIVLHGSLRQSLLTSSIFVTLSHSDSHVVAVVVIEDMTE